MKKVLLSACLLFLTAPSISAQVAVRVDCSQWEEFPLVKKIGLYQTPLVSKAWIDRDMSKLSELEARSMRYEMACGKDDLYGQPCVVGSAEKPAYALSAIDYLLSQARKNCPVLVISHGYTPTLLQRRPTEWAGFMDPPTDLAVWADINERFAQEWQSKGYTNSYVEVWNEPDLTDGFFTGTLDDYLNIYEAAAPAVRRGYADIKVGGPAGAFNWWHQALTDRVKAKNLPLDFLSGHAYGPDYAWQLDGMRTALNSLGRPEAEMLLTEYSPYVAADYQKDGPVERAEAAMTFFNALPGLLSYTDLTHVNWAQYIDPGFFVGDKLGLIDRDSGARKALFYAFKFYGWMPADRRQLTIGDNHIKGLASASDDCVALALWNTATDERPLSLTVESIPFTSGTLEVYHIDESHNSWYETKETTLSKSRTEHIETTDGRLVLDDVVRSRGVCFVRFVADGAGKLFPSVRLGTILRTHQWFPNRTNDAAYALFDPETWTVRLSSNKDVTGYALVGIEALRVPSLLKVQGITKGTVQRRTVNSSIDIRIDYQDKSGAYTKAVLFHGGVHTDRRKTLLPWGTRQQPDEVVEVSDLNDFTIDVAAHQPSDFSGRVIISFEMEAVGTGVKQRFQLSRGIAVGVGAVQQDLPSSQRDSGPSDATYNLSGQRTPHTVQGINILRNADGHTRKIYMHK